LQALLPAAALLQLPDVHQECCEFLRKQLHASNCLGIRDFAEMHSCQDLLSAAKTFVECHFACVLLPGRYNEYLIQCRELQQHEEFLALSAHQVCELISNDGLTAGEEKVFESAISWVRFFLSI